MKPPNQYMHYFCIILVYQEHSCLKDVYPYYASISKVLSHVRALAHSTFLSHIAWPLLII